ncbi:MAG: enhanced intracellular survival protein Eis, partial [Thermotogota bacterium]
MKFIKTDINEAIMKLMRFSFSIDNRTLSWLKREVEEEKKGLFDAYAVKDQSEYLSACYLWHLDMKLRNSIVKMSGIGNLASNAINRGKGAVKKLLLESLKLMRENDVMVSVLYPFSQSFYRKYGWEKFDDMYTCHFSPSIIKKNNTLKNYDIHHYYELTEAVSEFYNQFASTHYNYIQKQTNHWHVELEQKMPTDIDRRVVTFSQNGKIKSMILMLTSNQENETILVVREMTYLEQKDIMPIFDFLATLSLQLSKVTFNLPVDFEYWHFFNDRPEKTMLRERSMIRIVDMLLLNGLSINTPDFDIRLKVNDDFAKWNEGQYHIS